MMNGATKFVNQIINTGNFMEFYTPEVPFHHYQWLPVEWFQYVHELDEKKHYNVPTIYLKLLNKKRNINIKLNFYLMI
jgi:hypothetical protein